MKEVREIQTNTIDLIKAKIRQLYDDKIPINVGFIETRAKDRRTVNATIKTVYPYIFQLEETTPPHKIHTVQYADVLVKKVVISE